MAHEVIIDIETRFKDNATKGAKEAAKSFEGIEKAAEEAQKEVDELGKEVDEVGKAKVKPKVEADTSKATKKINDLDKKLDKLNRSTTEAKLSLRDRASALIEKVTSKAKAFGNKTYSGLIKLRDSNALSTLHKMSNGIKSLTSKAWSVAVRIKDTFTAPLTKLKNMLFNVRTLIAGIASAWAATKLVINPINVADAYSSAKISFSTLLGDSQGQQMMDDLDAFAKATPFKTTNVIGNAQKMLAMGWDAENIIEDMETIGNAAAATGKMDQGLESIVRALSQIKTKGRLSTEELNQLAEAGIAAKAMLAENLGYGTGDEGIAKMTKDLEDGAIASNVAIEALMAGMQKYDGMMDSMANETVEGLISQMQDVFEINLVRKWGQGLQDGAKRGFGTVVQLLDESEAALAEFGDMLYEIGHTASNWVADKLQGVVDKILTITDTFEFQNADLKGKISMLWDGLVADPLMEWWENGGEQKTAETAGKIGSWMGKMLTKGLLALFGATDVLNDGIGTEAGSSIAGSFLDGFLDNFDGQAITDAFVNAIKNVWGALPTWAQLLIGGYGIGKAAGGLSSFAGGVLNFAGGAKKAIGSFNIATVPIGPAHVTGSGIAGLVGKAGMGLGATTTGSALLMGSAGIAGGVAGGASLIKGGVDLYKGYHTDDAVEAEALKASGNVAIASTLAGAAIGTAIAPGIGTLIGAGIGGIAGWIGGDASADSIRAAKYESEEMKAAIKDSEMSAEELANVLAKAKWENAKKHFGDIKLTMTEIARIADQIVWGGDMAAYEQFTASVQAAEASLTSMKSSAETINRWMWKAGLGVKFNEDEVESIVASFDEYIASAKSFVENKHYEFTAAVDLLVDIESDGGKSILESGNAYYGGLQEQLTDLGGQLSDAINKALEDGVISTEPVTLPDGTLQLSEAEEIASLQQQIAEITEKVANAEQQAELDLIKVKFGKGNIDAESFENLMAQMQTTIDERVAASDEAFVASVSSLNLQLADGAITQEQYDSQLKTLIDGYTATMDGVKAQVKDVELEIIGNSYAQELGNDAAADLRNALDYALQFQTDPIELSDETLARLLNFNLDGENAETVSNIKDYLSGVFQQIESLDVGEDLTLNISNAQVETGEDFVESITGSLEEQLPDNIESDVGIAITGDTEVLNKLTQDELAAEFGLNEEMSETVYWKLKGAKTVEQQIEILCTDFGINKTEVETVLWKLTGTKQILKPFSLTALDFGIQSSYPASPVINVTPKLGTISPIVLPTSQLYQNSGGGGGNGKGGGFRGGIFGGDSAMDAFALGGRPDDGMLKGSTRFIRVNEEEPEMIIPLSSQRRKRALKLFAKTGELLDVPGFARGGIVGSDNQDEGIRFNTYGSGSSESGRSVHIDVGGVKLEINVSGSDREGIVEAIKAQAGELADYFVGVIADALETEFENTPVRGGAA